jgi:hypothetical protein
MPSSAPFSCQATLFLGTRITDQAFLPKYPKMPNKEELSPSIVDLSDRNDFDKLYIP